MKMQNVDQASLRQLRLGKRRGHAQDWLVGEENRSLRHGVYVAGEAKPRKLVEQCLAEASGLRQPLDVRRREAQVLQKVERLLQPGRHQESAASRQLAHEELEYRSPGIAMIQSRPASY